MVLFILLRDWDLDCLKFEKALVIFWVTFHSCWQRKVPWCQGTWYFSEVLSSRLCYCLHRAWKGSAGQQTVGTSRNNWAILFKIMSPLSCHIDIFTRLWPFYKTETLFLCPALQWHHNECDGVSNHQRLDCLLNRLFGRRSKETSKLRFTGLYEGNSLMTGEFPVQRASNMENVSIWWHHNGYWNIYILFMY